MNMKAKAASLHEIIGPQELVFPRPSSAFKLQYLLTVNDQKITRNGTPKRKLKTMDVHFLEDRIITSNTTILAS